MTRKLHCPGGCNTDAPPARKSYWSDDQICSTCAEHEDYLRAHADRREAEFNEELGDLLRARGEE